MSEAAAATASGRHDDCVPLCSLEDLERERIIGVQANGRELVVVQTRRGIRVLRGLCPHQGAALGGGVLCGYMAAGGIAEYRYERHGEIVRCPWHGWEFDSESGRSLHDPAHTRIATYTSHICDGQVCLGAGSGGDTNA